MELKDTIKQMTSADYKERFKAEYWQTSIRYNKLRDFIDKYERNELDFEPTCPMWVHHLQADIMSAYLNVLDQRAKFENVDLLEV